MNVGDFRALFGSALYDPRIAAIMDRLFESLTAELKGVNIEAEYELILQKKSRLCARLRRKVILIKHERDNAKASLAD